MMLHNTPSPLMGEAKRARARPTRCRSGLDAPVTEEMKVALLRRVCSVLNAHGVDYFLTCGALLGYLRGGRFIEWDPDIDIGMFDVRKIMEIEPRFAAAGLACSLSPGHPKRHCAMVRIRDREAEPRSKLWVDLFQFEKGQAGIVFRFVIQPWYYRVVQTAIRGSGRPKLPIRDVIEGTHIPRPMKTAVHRAVQWGRFILTRQGLHVFEPFTCVPVTWYGIDVRIPSGAVDHVRLLYGDTWRIPMPHYANSRERQRSIRRVAL